jgi:ketosteroid isomerase-like protein
MTDEALKNLFTEFEKAIGALDFEKIGELYADSFMAIGPDGVITSSKAEFLEGAHQAGEFYKSIRQTSLTIVSLEETEISKHYSLVTVRWGATFSKTGDKLVEFDDSYVVQRIGPEPKIVVLIAHQDERKVLKELGLVHN